MSFEEQIRQAEDPREALLLVGRALDEVLAAVAQSRTIDSGTRGWGKWGGVETGAERARESAAPAPPNQEFYAAKPAELDFANIARIEAHIDRLHERLDRNPADTTTHQLLDQAERALAAAQQPGQYLDNSGSIVGDTDIVKVDESDPDQVIIDLPPASPELKAHRRQLAEQIDLPSFFGPLWNSNADLREQIIEAYEKGGPLWLYSNRLVDGEHDIFTAMAPAAKTVMVADVHQFSPRMAWEFQRDIMKGEDTEGSGLAIAQDNIDGVIGGAHTPLRGGD